MALTALTPLPSSAARPAVQSRQSVFATGGAPLRVSRAACGGRPRAVAVEAMAKKKKKGGKKASGNPFKGAAKVPKTRQAPVYDSTDVIMWNLNLVESFKRCVGRPLLDDVDITEMAKSIFEAPFALMTQEMPEEDGGEPVLNYASEELLKTLGIQWADVVGKPSGGLLAENADAACSSLSDCKEKKFVEGYSGWLAVPGVEGSTKVKVVDGLLFNIEGPTEKVLGQGLLFTTYETADGESVTIGAVAVVVPTPEELEAAAADVTAKGAAVRALKEEEGLDNSDEQVQAAVAELLAAKGVLADMEAAVEAAAAEDAAEE